MNLQIPAAAVLFELIISAFATAADVAPSVPITVEKSDRPAESYVQPIDFAALAERSRTLPEHSKEIVRLYSQGGTARTSSRRKTARFPPKARNTTETSPSGPTARRSWQR